MSEYKPIVGWTKGPVTVGDNPRRTRIHLFDAHGAPLAVVESASANTSRAKSDAALIAEAFNVATETGLTPRQLQAELARVTKERDTLAEQREELMGAFRDASRAIGEHIAPDDCYATGPLTGDSIQDLVECLACRFIATHDAILTKCKEN